MKLREISLHGTTASGGALTVNASEVVFGKLYAVEWIDGTLADNVTAVISCQNTPSAAAQTLLTLGAGEGDNDKWYYPRNQAHGPDATALWYEAANSELVPAQAIVNGTLRLVIADGGNVKSGGCIVYVEV